MANADGYATNQGVTLNVPAPGVLGNDPDDDSPDASKKAVLVQAPSHGTVTLSANGAFTYNPAAGFAGIG